MLCELETDKVTVEVPATAAGVLAEIVAKEGETVGVDALLATIDEKAAANPAPAKAARAGGLDRGRGRQDRARRRRVGARQRAGGRDRRARRSARA